MTIPQSEYQRFGRTKQAKEASNGLSFEILLVDDEPPILSALSLCLKDAHHRVTTALSGQDALDLLHHKPFDLVVTDLQMPGIDGITLMRRVRDLRSNARVVIMTGSVLSDSIRRLIFREADGFLAKPFSLSELHHTVSSCLGSEILPPGPCRRDLSESLEALPP
jgi:two-component system competent response regulator ComA